MSSDIAIKVEQLSKCFHIYDKPHDRLLQMFARGRRQYYREFWALKDVSFEVGKGETVGIIGHNGSGKSTLLQMICGTLNPTSGTVRAQGRIAALLELGAGFNPEFTGRENVYLNATILGLTKEEIDERFDAIAAFADIGEFMAQPVKSYSSGMYVRLAFAVQSMIDPDIFIVDEALAVGDERFQRKCFARLENLKNNGTSILFVSHSAAQIVELCDRAVLIDGGEILTIGAPKEVVAKYQKLIYAPSEKRIELRAEIKNDAQGVVTDEKARKDNEKFNLEEQGDPQEVFDPNMTPVSTIDYESHGVRIENPIITDVHGRQINNLLQGKVYFFTYRARFEKGADNIRLGMMIKTLSGLELGGGATATSLKESIQFVESGTLLKVRFSFTCALTPGVYFLNAGVMGDTGAGDGFLHRIIDAAMFKVLPSEKTYGTGIIDFSCIPITEEIDVA